MKNMRLVLRPALLLLAVVVAGLRRVSMTVRSVTFTLVGGFGAVSW
jgi:hypothetical protein